MLFYYIYLLIYMLTYFYKTVPWNSTCGMAHAKQTWTTPRLQRECSRNNNNINKIVTVAVLGVMQNVFMTRAIVTVA